MASGQAAASRVQECWPMQIYGSGRRAGLECMPHDSRRMEARAQWRASRDQSVCVLDTLLFDQIHGNASDITITRIPYSVYIPEYTETRVTLLLMSLHGLVCAWCQLAISQLNNGAEHAASEHHHQALAQVRGPGH